MNPETANGRRPPARKRRRWWLYLLIAFAGLLLIAGLVVVGLVSYYHRLIARYTAPQPLALAAVDASPARLAQLKARWETFAQSVQAGNRVEPFKLSAADLNAFIAANLRDLSNRVRFQIRDDQLEAAFTAPLEKSGKKELRGRHLNGVARLDLKLEGGFLTLHAASLEANGKAIPGWIFSRIKNQNILNHLERNTEALEFLQRIDNVEVKDGSIVVTPVTSQ